MSDIIIVTPDIVGPVKNGGIGTACFHYARTLANAGYSIDILFTGPVDRNATASWKDFYSERRIGFWTLEDLEEIPCKMYGTRWYTERSWKIMQFLRKRNDRYVLFQDWHANGFWPIRAKRMGYGLQHATLGVIVHSPTEWQKAGMQTFGEQPLDEADLVWAERRTLAEADLLVSPSKHMLDWLSRHDYAVPKETFLCPITFEDPRQPTNSSGPDLDHLIFFGRLETRKGLHLLADALRLLPRSELPGRLSLLGKYATVEGTPSQVYIDNLRRDLPSISIEVHTGFDYAEAVDYIRRENGLVVMPSMLDNFPLTVVESITNGFHFIASNVGGIPELVDARALFDPTCNSLARKLAERRDIDFTGLQHHYSPETARSVWLRHVESVLSQSRANPISVAPTTHKGISVCIPFYKHDRYLRRLVASFLRMRRKDLQLVFVNDGTPEAECPIFHEMAHKLGSLGHVFHTQDNAGAGAARNKAVSLAKYDTILFFDADNVAFPNLVNDLQNALIKSGVDIVAAPFVAVPAMERVPVMSDRTFIYQPSGGSLVASLFDNLLCDMCCITYRKIIENLGGFQTSRFYWEDWEFFIQAQGRGFRLLVYPEPLFFYTHEPHERRVQTRAFTNYSGLWSRLEQMDKGVLANLARSVIEEVYAKRPQH